MTSSKEPEKAKEHIGYLPEIPPLYSEMTVEEYLKFAAELKRIPGKERAAQIEKAIKTAQLEDVRKRLINNLSKGYKQRVGLAQAVLGDPETIILDEPTVGLDPRQMIEMRELIRSLKKNHTVILSSHILSEVSAVCDQILIISKGELVASDTPDGLQAKLKGAGELELCRKGNCSAVKDAFVKSGRRRKALRRQKQKTEPCSHRFRRRRTAISASRCFMSWQRIGCPCLAWRKRRDRWRISSCS